MRRLMTVIAAALLVVGLSACDDDNDTSTQKEAKSRSGSYDAQVAKQPAETMDYSPSRDTINFWIKTWREPNKLSYVYLQNANGDLIGYYVLKGLPVSYCAALTPNYEFVRPSGVEDKVMVPAPGVDGVYYSGGQCNTYYGQDATSGSYIEYTVGMGINVLLYDQPLPAQDVERRGGAQPLGPTSVEDVKN